MNSSNDERNIDSRKELSEYRLEKAHNCLKAEKALLEIELYEDAGCNCSGS